MGPVTPCRASRPGRLGLAGHERSAVLDEKRRLNLMVVCAANVCRSPLAEYLLGRGLKSLPEFEGHSVSSAGVDAHPDAEICSTVGGTIGPVGSAFVSGHRSRLVTADDVGRSGLVLTASRAERAAIARLDPSARSRTFTLREAAALAVGIPTVERTADGDASAEADVAPLTRFARAINSRRGLVSSPRASGRVPLWRRTRRVVDPLDIIDGHNLGTGEHRSALDEVASAVEVVLDALRSQTR